MKAEEKHNDMQMATNQQMALYGAQQQFDLSKYTGKFYPDNLEKNPITL